MLMRSSVALMLGSPGILCLIRDPAPGSAQSDSCQARKPVGQLAKAEKSSKPPPPAPLGFCNATLLMKLTCSTFTLPIYITDGLSEVRSCTQWTAVRHG